MVDYAALGKRIKKLREDANMRQEDLAERCNCSISHIGQIEHARSIPSIDMLVNIANALEVSPDALLLESIDKPEDAYLRKIKDKLAVLPTATRIKVCESLDNLLGIIGELN
ncbi:MAG: helix-turn-helix transcriptional regulator [Bacteroidales bacterium]|nr:helix-turn-helix transcriptional regulator [Bacteroidales bacterium]